MKTRFWLAWLLLIFAGDEAFGAAQRGVVLVPDPDGGEVALYRGSHALLIGVSDYTNGWSDLESVPSELNRVEQVLRAQGFTVEKVTNPDARQLERAFEDFIRKYGFDTENRLLFYFAGHGHTRKGTKGYLVPADAPDPRRDEKGFLRKALDMSQVIAWTRRIEAKHALFLFDSCFSGTVFKARNLPERSHHITTLTRAPIRQFITAGSAGEPVPAKSTFAQVFVDGIAHRLADLDGDGFVTGTELGYHIQSTVPEHVPQTPQFGKHPDYELSRGDFVFALAPEAVVETETMRPMPVVTSAAEPLTLPLTVNTSPSGARVRILNIGPRYRDGMALKPGQYHIEVTHPGHEKHLSWHTLQPGNEVLTVELEVEKPSELSRKPSQPNVLQPEMVGIKRGCFQMGSLSDGKDHRKDERRLWVCVEDFRIGKYEVTQAQWRAVMGNNPSHFKDCDDCPVERISWNDVQRYLEKLNARTGKGYRLPTEAEWEYACRGGRAGERYCGGNDSDPLAWHINNSGSKTHPVGGKRGNGFGLYDMSGNVWEWTCSGYDKDYGGGESQCVGIGDKALRVIRGGSWIDDPRSVRAAARSGLTRDYRDSLIGFRLAQGEPD